MAGNSCRGFGRRVDSHRLHHLLNDIKNLAQPSTSSSDVLDGVIFIGLLIFTRIPIRRLPVAIRIQPRTWKNKDGSITETWRLIVEDYSNGDRQCFYPEKSDYHRYGLNPSDTLTVALEKLTAVRSANRLTRNIERREKIHKRLDRIEQSEGAYLPASTYNRFIAWLKDRRMWDAIPPKTESHLRAMRQLVIDVSVCPSEWPTRPEKIYRWFHSKKYSLSYVDKVLPLLNDYGYFYCKEFSKPYLPVKQPTGDVARRLDDANFEERDGDGGASKPLTSETLHKLAGLKEPQYRWVRLTYYFGLRPSEADRITPDNRGKTWKLTADSHGTTILHVYQPKLVRLERERRWKRIPCVLKEQRELVEELKLSLPTKRPYPRTVEKYAGEGVYLYGGRKGFEKLMRTHGQSGVNISRWLGHQDLSRTDRNYRDTEAVEYTPVD